MKPACTICGRPGFARGWCMLHWARWRRHGDPLFAVTYEMRFWRSVEKTNDCWIWKGAKAGGYGQCRRSANQQAPAHRYSYEIHFGEIPSGMYVCHRCDNKLCVRPEHLFLGTAADNMQDMVSKGRHPKQVKSFRSKLTIDQVRQIRNAAGTCIGLAKQFGVDPNTIRNIKTRRTWAKTE